MLVKSEKKSFERLFTEMILSSLFVLAEVRFFKQITGFGDEVLDVISPGMWFEVLFAFLTLIILWIPFMILFDLFNQFSMRLNSKFNGVKQLGYVTIFYICVNFYVAMFWLLEAKGILNAIIFEINDLNYFLIAAIIFMSWRGALFIENIKQFQTSLKTCIVLCFVFGAYFWFALDDGCTYSGGDGLFAGGDIDCDPSYEQVSQSKDKLARELGVNSNALFAAQYLWMSFLGIFSIIAVSYFRVLKRKIGL